MPVIPRNLTFDPQGDVRLLLHYPRSGDDSQNGNERGLANGLAAASIHEPASRSSSTDSNVLFTPTSSVTLPVNATTARRSIRSVSMMVSSRHLILASPAFRRRLQHRLPAGQTTFQPRAELNLPDDDPNAFEILMNIIHLQFSRVPAQVDLQMLLKLSVLVNKYEIWQATGPHVKDWVSALESSIPLEYGPDIMTWICISWVFRLRDVYKNVTRVAQQESKMRLLNTGQGCLPIPPIDLDKIETERQSGLSDMIATINEMLTRYTQGTRVCNVDTRGGVERRNENLACDGLMLGSLIQGLINHRLWPLPQPPYRGLSIKTVASSMRNLKLMAVCDHNRFFPVDNALPHPGHGWMETFRRSADAAIRAANGLDLVTPDVDGNIFGVTV